MPTLSGTISEQELQAYGGAGIALLNDTGEETNSGTTISGGATYNFTLTYGENGFTGGTVEGPDWNTGRGFIQDELGLSKDATFEEIDTALQKNMETAAKIAYNVYHFNYEAFLRGCADIKATSIM